MVSKIALIDYLMAQSQIYCECPVCMEMFRLNEARLTFGIKAKRDLLSKLREQQQQFNEVLQKARKDARKRSRAISKGMMLEHICPHLPTFKHHPRDARFLGDPIDFVIFNGLFSSKKVDEIIIAEVKSGDSKMSEEEKSVQKAVEKGKVNFELIQVE